MNLLSQMSAAPIDCLFKVNNFYGRIHMYLHISCLYPSLSAVVGNYNWNSLECNEGLISAVKCLLVDGKSVF